MFRRPGKNPLEDNGPLYQEEKPHASPYKYGSQKGVPTDTPPRLFDTPHGQLNSPMPSQERRFAEEEWGSEKTMPLPHHLQGMMHEEEPETTLGEGVSFRGELSFERLLRIDGTFEGELLSQGKVIVGPKGKVKANLNLREAIIEGTVEGNITVQEKLLLRGDAFIKGDIRAKSICVDEGVRILGHMTVMPDSREEPA